MKTGDKRVAAFVKSNATSLDQWHMAFLSQSLKALFPERRVSDYILGVRAEQAFTSPKSLPKHSIVRSRPCVTAEEARLKYMRTWEKGVTQTWGG